jgi:hypothetical protein
MSKTTYSLEELNIAKTYKPYEWGGFTRYAAAKGYVTKRAANEIYFANMRTGMYIAYGSDIDGRPFKRAYIVDQSDRNSPWTMWRDYCGRYGLTNIWHITENGKRLIHRK